MDYSQLGNKKRKRSPHATRMQNKIGLLIMRVVFSVVLIVGFAAAGAGMGVYMGILNASPELDISALGPVSPHAFDAAFMGGTVPSVVNMSSHIVCARTGEEREVLHGGQNHVFAHISDMPQYLIDAFIAIEDERFFEHNGVDPRGILRAIWVTTQPDRSTEGASTITQQLVKNMLGVMDNTFITKLQEQNLAITLERHLADEFARLEYEDPRMEAKMFILQSYLNMINLGRQNYGVQAAARFYYDVDVSELTLVQSATIAAITQNPSRFPPDIRPHDNWRRTQLVLFNMYERLGLITTEEYEDAMQARQVICPESLEPMYDEDGEPIMLGLVYDTIFRRDDGGTRLLMSEFDCFTDALLAQVRQDLMTTYNMTGDQADHRIFRTGLTILSTQDLEMQAVVDRAFLDESLWPDSRSGFSIEVTYEMTVLNTITQMRRFYRREAVVDNEEQAHAFVERIQNQLLTHADEIVSERMFLLPQPQGAFVILDHHTGHVMAMRGIRGEKQGNRSFNRATQATRSPGSQMKPLVPFAPMIELGIAQPSTVIDDIPFILPAVQGRGWEPGNHWGSTFRGLMTVRQAIYQSANVVSARAAADSTIPHAGVPTMVRYLEQMGISTLHPHDGPAMVLGGMTNGVHLIELAGAYATIANQGEYNRPVLYTMVLDHEGNILLENSHNPQRVFRATTAYLLTNSMQDTIGRGTGGAINWTSGSGLRGRIPIAGKTGTSQRNSDLGFSGFTPYFTASIWFGNDNHQPMHRNTRSFHMPLWRTIMEEIHRDLPARQFQRPPGITNARVCLDSGHLPTDFCRTDPRGDRSRPEVFAPGMVPTQTCRVHQQHTICTESNLLASAACPYAQTRVGLVRAQPIDHITAPVSDRAQEFSLGVRQGLSCTVCAGGGFQQPPSESEFIWNMDTGQWIVNPNFNRATPQPGATSPPVNLDMLSQNSPNAPPPTPSPTPTPWPGLGSANANNPVQTQTPFVNTVTVPGLN
jgi:penicillin-binding protein 1A